MRHLAYLKYVLVHKWFVLVASFKFKVGLWQAIIHDASKFHPAEWFSYAAAFYAPNGKRHYMESPEFVQAWNHHQKANPHHWQYWLITYDRGETFPLPMPEKYIREMLADWAAAGRTITGKWEYREWYYQNRGNMTFHTETRLKVEQLIKEIII